jgi:hypothetical protein
MRNAYPQYRTRLAELLAAEEECKIRTALTAQATLAAQSEQAGADQTTQEPIAVEEKPLAVGSGQPERPESMVDIPSMTAFPANPAEPAGESATPDAEGAVRLLEDDDVFAGMLGCRFGHMTRLELLCRGRCLFRTVDKTSAAPPVC